MSSMTIGVRQSCGRYGATSLTFLLRRSKCSWSFSFRTVILNSTVIMATSFWHSVLTLLTSGRARSASSIRMAALSSTSWALAPGYDMTTIACFALMAGSSSFGMLRNDKTPAMSMAATADQKRTGRFMKNSVSLFIKDLPHWLQRVQEES